MNNDTIIASVSIKPKGKKKEEKVQYTKSIDPNYQWPPKQSMRVIRGSKEPIN